MKRLREVEPWWQAFAARQQIGDPPVSGVAPCQQPARQHERLACLPVENLVARDRIQIHATRIRAGAHCTFGQSAGSGCGSVAGPLPSSTNRACRVAAQFGIRATGSDAAWVG